MNLTVIRKFNVTLLTSLTVLTSITKPLQKTQLIKNHNPRNNQACQK